MLNKLQRLHGKILHHNVIHVQKGETLESDTVILAGCPASKSPKKERKYKSGPNLIRRRHRYRADNSVHNGRGKGRPVLREGPAANSPSLPGWIFCLVSVCPVRGLSGRRERGPKAAFSETTFSLKGNATASGKATFSCCALPDCNRKA